MTPDEAQAIEARHERDGATLFQRLTRDELLDIAYAAYDDRGHLLDERRALREVVEAASRVASHFTVKPARSLAGFRLLDHVCYDKPGQGEDGCGTQEDDDLIALIDALAALLPPPPQAQP